MVLLPFDDDWRDLGKVNCKKLKSSIFFLIDDLQKMRTFVQIKAKPIPLHRSLLIILGDDEEDNDKMHYRSMPSLIVAFHDK